MIFRTSRLTKEKNYTLATLLDKDRLHQQHWMLNLAFGSNFDAPVIKMLEEGINVLDAGCGMSSWKHMHKKEIGDLTRGENRACDVDTGNGAYVPKIPILRHWCCVSGTYVVIYLANSVSFVTITWSIYPCVPVPSYYKTTQLRIPNCQLGRKIAFPR